MLSEADINIGRLPCHGRPKPGSLRRSKSEDNESNRERLVSPDGSIRDTVS